jgi:predicted dehydrogenase
MSMTRRSVLGSLTALSYSRVLGANDRVGVGFIGYGLIGAQHVYDFSHQDDANLVALAETFEPRLQQGVEVCNRSSGGGTRPYKDFRRLLDDKDVDAVVVSTPDHWHALLTMMACQAGKDVYVEKPMTLFVREGRWMADVARKYKRIVQVGTQQRSGKHYRAAHDLLRQGHLGKVVSVRMGTSRNITPGFGRPEGAQPENFNYDMWLGPAPAHAYSPHRGLYHFRWFWDYSGGQMTNLGAHEIDILQWFLGQLGPMAVTSSGGRFALEDDGETPDVQDALFEYPGFTSIWSERDVSAGRRTGYGTEFFGTRGSLAIGRSGWELFPDSKTPPENAIPSFQGQPQGGPQRAKAEPELLMQPGKMAGSSSEQFDLHVRGFLDCVKSRQRPIADAEDGHRTATACHLANISYRTGRKIRWDPEAEQIVGDSEAAAMLERPYRKPWDAVLRGLLS